MTAMAMRNLRDKVAGKIRDAYYHARDHGGTMDSAGYAAADSLLAVLSEMASSARAARLAAFRDAEHAMRRYAEIWAADGTDPCRVRVVLDIADTLKAWADDQGSPVGPATAWRKGHEDEVIAGLSVGDPYPVRVQNITEGYCRAVSPRGFICTRRPHRIGIHGAVVDGILTDTWESEDEPEGLWTKRNSASGRFDDLKKKGDVFKGVRKEN